jgi:cytochrome c oxidase subunit IV
MEQHQHAVSPEVSVVAHHDPSTKRIWKTFWVLLIITVIELGLGLSMYWFPDMSFAMHVAVKGLIVILSLSKAFYIVSIFMHLGDEIRNMIMTIVVPLMLFVWFIGAFLWDGNSWKNLRNDYDTYKKDESTKKVEEKKNEEATKPEHLQ